MYKQEKKNGKVQFFESYYDPDKKKYRTVSVTMPNASRASEKEAYAVLQERIRDKVLSPKAVMLDTLLEEYVKYQKENRRAATAESSKYYAHTLQALLGNVNVNDLTAGYVIRQLDATDHTNTWKNNVVARLKPVMRWAYQRDYVKDISWIAKLPRYQEQSARAKVTDKYLEPSELKALLDALEPPYDDFCCFLALSGLRVGEAFALTASDLDTKNKVIHVTKTRTRHRVGKAKTADSVRDVHMQPELYSLCVKLKKTASVPYVFPFSYGQVCRALRKVDETVTPHVLRHTHASLLFSQGFSIDEVAHRLGHSNSTVTRMIYVHLTEARKQKENDKLDAFSILG